MANKTITQLDTITPASADEIPIWDISEGTTGKISIDKVSGINSVIYKRITGDILSDIPLPGSGVETVVGSITLTKGKWFLFLNAWMPTTLGIFSIGNNLNISSNGYIYPQSGCGFESITTERTLNLTYTNWDSSSTFSGQGVYLYAIRIGV